MAILYVGYSLRVSREIPVVDVICKVFADNPKDITVADYLRAALVVIEKVERCEGILLEFVTQPEEVECSYFSAGFRSYSELYQFMDIMGFA